MARKDMGLNDDVPHMAADDDFNTVIILSQIRWPVNTEFASVPIDERKAHTSSKGIWEGLAFLLVPLVPYILLDHLTAAFANRADEV